MRPYSILPRYSTNLTTITVNLSVKVKKQFKFLTEKSFQVEHGKRENGSGIGTMVLVSR